MQLNDNRPIYGYETEEEGYFDTEGFMQWRNHTRVLHYMSSVRDFLLSSHNAMTAILQPLDTSIFFNEALTQHLAVTEEQELDNLDGLPEEQESADLDGLPDLEVILPYIENLDGSPEEQESADLDGLPDLEVILPYQGPLTLQQTIFMDGLARRMYGVQSLPFTNELEVDVADRNNE